MRALMLIIVASATACGPDFAEEWKVDGYRVLGIEAEPPEVDPDGQATLTVWDVDSEGRAPTYTWSLCLFSLGAVTGFKCLDPALVRPMPEAGPVAALDFGPTGLDVRGLYAALQPVTGQDGEAITLEDGFDVYVHLVSTVPGGRTVSTYKRVRVRDGAPLNTNPTVAEVRLDGATGPFTVTVGEEAEIELILDDASREVTPEGRTESFIYKWYTFEGSFDFGFGGQGRTVDYKAPSQPGVDRIYAVVRDTRGGASLIRVDVQVVAAD